MSIYRFLVWEWSQVDYEAAMSHGYLGHGPRIRRPTVREHMIADIARGARRRGVKYSAMWKLWDYDDDLLQMLQRFTRENENEDRERAYQNLKAMFNVAPPRRKSRAKDNVCQCRACKRSMARGGAPVHRRPMG